MSSAKGFLWSFIFLLTAGIYGSIPTYLMVEYWQWLNSFTLDGTPSGTPVYTIPLFLLFLWIISLVVTLIYLVAMIRAIVQRKSEDLGIPRGVKGFGLISSIIIIAFMVIWYIIFQEIAFFSMVSPL
ncbi:MAG: hypothetical protein ACFFBY_06405 [Promethearchaeota archaeon]